MNKQNVVYLYNGILFSQEKEQSADGCYDVNESWSYTKWKKPEAKGHTLYDSIYMKCPKQTNP